MGRDASQPNGRDASPGGGTLRFFSPRRWRFSSSKRKAERVGPGEVDIEETEDRAPLGGCGPHKRNVPQIPFQDLTNAGKGNSNFCWPRQLKYKTCRLFFSSGNPLQFKKLQLETSPRRAAQSRRPGMHEARDADAGTADPCFERRNRRI